MDILTTLLAPGSPAQSVVIISLAAILGLSLGHLSYRGIGLGIAGVLFAGLGLGHFGLVLDHKVLEFIREFGLILFVYTIGLQVGPGFIASLRKEGLALNVLAAVNILLAALATWGVFVFFGVDIRAAVGIFSGATTNTPSLGAAQSALASIPGMDPAALQLPGLGYAVSYPGGVAGIIASMLIVRLLCRINIPAESAAHTAETAGKTTDAVTSINLIVRNLNFAGLSLSAIPGLAASSIVISRVRHGGETTVATSDTTLQPGDTLLAVGPAHQLRDLELILGEKSNEDLRHTADNISIERIIVTHTTAVGRSVASLNLPQTQGVTLTRVHRSDTDIPLRPGLTLHFGDTVTAVGPAQGLLRTAALLGNSVKELSRTDLVTLFIGLLLGVLLGSLPIPIPGIPVPVRLGLAGGPLIIAMLLSRIHKVGPLVWRMPQSANFLLREFGITLFLACVGLKAGENFVATLVGPTGLLWFLSGLIVTTLPLLLVAFIARLLLKMNFMRVLGLMAGSMTDPPALAFAHTISGSDAPATSYAAVYPLSMLLRVIAAQLIVLFLV